MEIGMKEDKDVADEISSSNLVSRSPRNLAQSATKCTYLQFMVLEGKDCDKNLHEEEDCNLTFLLLGHCARNVRNRVCGAPKHTYFCGLTKRAVAVSFLLHEIN